MKAEHLRKLSTSLLTLGAVLSLTGSALAATYQRPYFKTFGGDVMVGGWFNSGGSNSCDNSIGSNYQDPFYSNVANGVPASNQTASILSYALDSGANSRGGSSSQYGVYTPGAIEGNSANMYGFYSAGALAPTTKYYTTFGNNNLGAAPWGGLFGGTVRQTHCIPDYYSKKPTTGTSPLTSGAFPGVGIFTASTAPNATWDLNSGGAWSIPTGKTIEIFVLGNVYISNNITYNYGLNRDIDTPKFTLVVKGNIYISNNVTQLDGWYIAQPRSNTASAVVNDDGNIWTCHPNNTNPVNYTYPSTCTNKLVVNGALTAKQVNFLRVKGDVASANTSEDQLSNALSSGNIAEIINFTPSMTFNGDFFSESSSTGLKVDSLISLPPVY